MPGEREGETFVRLMEDARAGSPEAAAEICGTFGPRVIELIRRRMNPVVRNRFDSVDVMQDVWKSFFEDLPTAPAFDDSQSLKSYLYQMARNKVATAHRVNFGGQKNDPAREQAPNHAVAVDPPGTGATASQEYMAIEKWERMLDFTPPEYQPILKLLVRGATQEEISQELGFNVRTVRRLIRRLEEACTA